MQILQEAYLAQRNEVISYFIKGVKIMSENIKDSVIEKAETVEATVENSKKVDKNDKTKKAKKEKKPRKKPFREMFSELKKVSWPSKEDLRTYAVCVVVFVVVCAVLLGLMDIGASYLVGFLSDQLPNMLNELFGIGG